MRKNFILPVVLLLLAATSPVFADNHWMRVDNTFASRPMLADHLSAYMVYETDIDMLRKQLFSLSAVREEGGVVELPLPDGTTRYFRVWYSPIMPAGLAARYPGLRTFTGVAMDDPGVTAKLDYTLYGFHAMIFEDKGISFIDPADDNNSGYYVVHYKKDEVAQVSTPANCMARHIEPVINGGGVDMMTYGAAKTSNGYQLRTYRIALSCSHQYAAAVTSLSAPLISQVLSKMTTTMNRVNGVYEREISATMMFVDKEDTLIWNMDTGGPNGPDPFSAIDGNSSACLPANQTACDDRIGEANYDVGHVFTTNAGGYSLIGVLCKAGLKAQSVTGQAHPYGDGFDIDYVVHEMGHEFGAEHTFNNSHDGSCGGFNINAETAYEPGSGSTIMAYAGICSPDNIQPHSDDYFHTVSLMEIQYYLTTGGDVCAIKTPTNNKPVALPTFQATYSIPFLTPFELTAPDAVDSVGSSAVYYCWDQWNLGDVGQRLINTHYAGPIFRSFKPVTSPTRIFPKDTMVLKGVLSDAGNNNWEGESAPDVARFLTFRLAMRNIYQGHGCVLIPDDTIHLDVINTGSGFKVTSQGDSTLTYVGNSLQNITWDVAGTNAAPISAATVEIFMSEDGGYTWPHHIGTFPNTGSASVPLPNPDTTTTRARIKVKGTGNVFFNVNKYNFSVTHSDGTDTSIRIYPVPVKTTLRISSGNKGMLQFRIYNSIGRLAFSGEVNGIYDVPLQYWPRGMYLIRMIDLRGQKTVKKFVVE